MSKTKIVKVTLTIASIVIVLIAAKGYMLYQAISPNPISFWQTSDENNQQAIDHHLWGQLLNKYLHENINKDLHEFDYRNVTIQDKAQLSQYLQQMQAIDPRNYRKDVQLAYWANLYNALTIDIILKHYPLESIKEIGDGFTGPWNIELIDVAGKPLTLNKIEHGILRALWQDNRVHYVINCASIGCPDLPRKALSGKNIERQLEHAAKRFVNQNKGVNFINGRLTLSSIYDWFLVDFGDNHDELLKHLSDYAKPKLKTQLTTYKDEIDFQYNWKLNALN
jgi:hypothetical protein